MIYRHKILMGSFNFPLFFVIVCIGMIQCGQDVLVFAETGKMSAKDQKNSSPAPITLTLDQAIQIAFLSNRSIANARFRAESQQYNVTSAKSDFDLKIMPLSTIMYGSENVSGGNNINLGLSLQKKLESGTSIYLSPSFNITDQQNNNSLGLTIEQPLFKGFGRNVTLDNVRAAEFSQQSAVRNIYQTKENVALDMIATFYNAVKQREIQKLYEASGIKLKGHSAIAQAKEKVGLTTPMDTYRAEINLKELENAATQTMEAYQDLMDHIKIILSLPLKTNVELIAPEGVDLTSMDLSETIETALKNRIEIVQAKAEIEEAERRVAVLKNSTLPGLKLVLNVGPYAAAYNTGQTLNTYQNNWSLMLQGTTDLMRTPEKSALQQGMLTTKMLRLDLESKNEEISKQVRKQWTALKENEKRIRIRKEQIRQAEEKLALAEVKYAHDMANNFDIIEAETELQKAKVMLLSEEMDYALGTYNMKAVLGILIQKD